MKKCFFLATALLAVQTAQAHFVWIVPAGDGTAKLIFSDSLDPDDNVPISKIAQTVVTARGASLKSIPVTKTAKADHFLLSLPTKSSQGAEIRGACTYGVLQKTGEPYLLSYCAKTSLTPLGPISSKAAPALPLEIVAVESGKFAVLWNGKATADVEVVAMLPKMNSSRKILVNKDGSFTIQDLTAAPGMVGLRAKMVEKKAGELSGKKYTEVRHYTTWTFNVGSK